MIRATFRGIALLAAVLLTFWCGLALWFDGPPARGVAAVLAGGFVLGAILVAFLVRPGRRAFLVWLLGTGLVLGWWLSIAPSNDRSWMPDVARLPRAEIDGDRLTIHNVRNFDYRSETDFTPRWEDRTYDLRRVRAVDMFLSYWGPRAIAHTITSWEFDDGSHLAISIETRKEVGESYSAVRGFFRQYELYYVVADERDVIRLRTNFRGETVYLYRFQAPPEFARAFLLDYLRKVNELAERPEWYNALTQNCTTAIRVHARNLSQARAWNWRILANGYGDEMLYRNGRLDTSLPFAELRARSDITAKAKEAGFAPDFSERIRAGVPGFRGHSAQQPTRQGSATTGMSGR